MSAIAFSKTKTTGDPPVLLESFVILLTLVPVYNLYLSSCVCFAFSQRDS